MDIGTIFVKYCLCLFNFVFVVFGMALLGFGIWLVADQSSVVTLLKFADHETIRDYGTNATVIEQLGYVLIAMGAFIFVISFLGYCGTLKESRLLLGAYAFFLTLIFILEIVLVVLVVVYRKEAEGETRSILTISVQNHFSTRERANAFTVALDFLQAEGHCCGISNFTDFRNARLFKENSTRETQVPVSCCKLAGDPLKFNAIDPSCTTSPNEGNSYLFNGCFDSLVKQLMDKFNFAIIAGVIVALLQIIGIVFSICVFKAAYYDYK
ncbi:CD151 antigen [Folsomia candida]|uniref:Tetraspanin n=1 Tax=Folsomia candida TaxID=158441 RepID=A0A226EIK7_FOLCA|nr:CD151 antigen [Folsomia candida]XP_021949926.1 CD151 antigen [Folsomia candida]XP_035705207.1 CD151 antigen [Folsomia candida]OXA57543.1 Tetraspanin-11 [Folsomia candida]